jgi:hypothetical protein
MPAIRSLQARFCRWLLRDIPICGDHNGRNREDWNGYEVLGMPPFANANQGVFVDEIGEVARRRGWRCVI